MPWGEVQKIPTRYRLIIYRLLQCGVIGYSKDAVQHYELVNAISTMTNVYGYAKGLKQDIVKIPDFKHANPLVYDTLLSLHPEKKSEQEIQDDLAKALFTWIDAGEGLKEIDDSNQHELRE